MARTPTAAKTESDATTNPPVAAAATPEKKRINVHRFTISGYIPINMKDTKTIVAAADATNEAVESLKKAGATIEREDAAFTQTNVGEPAPEGE